MLVTAVAACTKASGPADGNSIQPNNSLDTLVNFKTLINRLSWQADSAFGSLVNAAGNDSNYVNLLITAYGNNHGKENTISFFINNFTGPGIFNVNPPYVVATYYVGNNRFLATNGQVVITSLTTYGMLGTFNFTADSFSITNGVFNVAEP